MKLKLTSRRFNSSRVRFSIYVCPFIHRAAVTDDLISPKYDDDIINDESTDDGDDEDDESDDTVYECPGMISRSSEGKKLFAIHLESKLLNKAQH